MQGDTRRRPEHGGTRPDTAGRGHLQLVRQPTGPVQVQLPPRFDTAAALGLTLPMLVDLILEVPHGFDASCEALLQLAWRCTARCDVDVSALPADPRACLRDWLLRTKRMDLDGQMPVGA